MNRLAPLVLCLAAACASSPGSAPESEPLRPAPGPVAVSDSLSAVWRQELQPGDVLRVSVWRSTELSGEFIVGPNGKLLHPLYQTIDVVNLPPQQVTANVAAFLARFETNPQFYVEPLYRVYVGGEVRQGGLFNVPQTTTIPQAIAVGGGPAQDADMTDVKLLRGRKVTTYDLTSLGLALDTLHVQSGDQLIVGKKFNFLRDYAGPVASLVTMLIAIGYYTRR